MLISLLVAASENNVIGKDNQLLWHLPNDMKFFKDTTWGMPVIMGRKTFESLHSKPLNARINIILTSRKQIPSSGKIDLASTVEESLTKARETDCKEVFVIGGGEVFKLFYPIADRIYITRVKATLEGDTYFPVIDQREWKLFSSHSFDADERHKYAYDFQLWIRANTQISP
jgi:dihydrofolate reductase